MTSPIIPAGKSSRAREMTAEEFAFAVRAHRGLLGLTQTEAAERMRMLNPKTGKPTRRTWSEWEAGRQMPPLWCCHLVLAELARWKKPSLARPNGRR